MVLKEMYPPAYEELRVLAHRHRQRWRGHYTLDTVALMSEAYLKLARAKSIHLKSRAHFLALVAKAMRQILLDYARQHRPIHKVSLDEMESLCGAEVLLWREGADVLVALDEALERLAQFDRRQSQVVECRFFGGLTIHETAEALGIATATVNRDWAVARTWLCREIRRILRSYARVEQRRLPPS
jgi:RNA polymerase sigma factor (TIGR02999 family)